MKPLFSEEQYKKAKSRINLPVMCYHCNKTFYIEKHYIKTYKKSNNGRYCSTKCQMEHQHPPITTNCEQCRKKIKRPKCEMRKKHKYNFCSHSCRATYYNTHKTKGTRVSKLENWLQTQLTILYPTLMIKFNETEPINSELDIYIPSLKLAFELNGIFHYEPIFGESKLNQTQNNDNRKMLACSEYGISLCVIDTTKQTYFKEKTSQLYLKIITDIINATIQPGESGGG